MSVPRGNRSWRWALVVLGVAIVYTVAARYGLSLAVVDPQVSPVWPPTAIALAALVIFGRHLWPGVAIGAFAANAMTIPDDVPAVTVAAIATGIAAGNTLEAVVGATLLKMVGFRPSLDRVRDVVALVFLAAVVSTVVSATVGVTSLFLGGLVAWQRFLSAWWLWWLGDAMGVLVLAPMLLTWAAAVRFRARPTRVVEAAIAITALVITSYFVLVGPLAQSAQLVYLVFPFVTWSALRLHQTVTAAAVVTIAGMAIWGATNPDRGFVAATLTDRLVLLQTFIGVLSAATLAAGAATAQVRAAEFALRESEERLRLATESGGIGVWSRDIAAGIVRWSPLLERIFGLAPGGFRGTQQAFLDLVHPEDRDRVRLAVEESTRQGSDYEIEFRFLKDGEVRWMAARGRTHLDSEGRPLRRVGVGLDITDRRVAEEELARYRDRLEEMVRLRTAELEASHEKLRGSERMAALGTLAAGLGHDIGNLLLPMRARLEALGATPLSPEAREDLSAISLCAQYLHSLSRGLRLFARDPSRSASGVTDIADWWRDVAVFLKTTLPAPLALDATIEAHLPPVAISAERLTQIVFNLITNAQEAIQSAGPSKHSASADIEFRVELDPDTHAVRLVVRDRGPGMSDEVRRHCLEPFYTTKSRGISTGLGLSLVHGIATAAGGSIRIDSEPGRGTTVTLCLPVVNHDGPPEVPATACVSVQNARLGATIRRLLESQGFAATTGDPGPHDLWITDPTPDSLRAARTIFAENPRCRILVLGATDQEWTRIGALHVEPTPSAIRRALEASERSRIAPNHDPD